MILEDMPYLKEAKVRARALQIQFLSLS